MELKGNKLGPLTGPARAAIQFANQRQTSVAAPCPPADSTPLAALRRECHAEIARNVYNEEDVVLSACDTARCRRTVRARYRMTTHPANAMTPNATTPSITARRNERTFARSPAFARRLASVTATVVRK